jgi:hypothetical protein
VVDDGAFGGRDFVVHRENLSDYSSVKTNLFSHPTRLDGGATIEEASPQLWRVHPMLSLESLNRLHFPDGCVRPEFRQKLLDSGITPEQIAWLEEDAADEMKEWMRRRERRSREVLTIWFE